MLIDPDLQIRALRVHSEDASLALAVLGVSHQHLGAQVSAEGELMRDASGLVVDLRAPSANRLG